MHVRVAIIIGGLIAAGAAWAPALAKVTHVRKATVTMAARGAVHRTALKQPAAGKSRVAARPAASPVETAGHGRHHRGGKATQKRNKDKDSGSLAMLDRNSPAAVNFPAEAVGWRLIEDAGSGARLGLPEKLVPRAGVSRTGSRWTSAQGQIQIETFHLTEAALPALFEEEKKASHRQVTSSALKPDSFVIVGVQGLKNFVVRADARGGEVRGVSILYDQATEGIMGRVAIAIASSFAGFPDPNAAPLPGLRRTVEYGTAIVVTSDGDLLAPARLTDECQAITVPGLGHAERVAADPANNLALIRLYGARNLIARGAWRRQRRQRARQRADARRRRRSAGSGGRRRGDARCGEPHRAGHRAGAEARFVWGGSARRARPLCRHGEPQPVRRRRQWRHRARGSPGAGGDRPRFLAGASHFACDRRDRRDRRGAIGAARDLREEVTAYRFPRSERSGKTPAGKRLLRLGLMRAGNVCFRGRSRHRTSKAVTSASDPSRKLSAHRSNREKFVFAQREEQSWSRGTFFAAPLDHFIGGAKMH